MAPTNLGLQLKTMIRGAHYMIPANSSLSTVSTSGPIWFPSTSRAIISKHMHLVRDVVSSIPLLQGNKYSGPKNNNNNNNITTAPRNPSTPHNFDVNDMLDFGLAFLTVSLMLMFVLGLVMLAVHAGDFVHRNGYARERELRVLSVRRQHRRRQLQQRRECVRKISAAFGVDVDIEAGHALASDRRKSTASVPSYGAMDSSHSS